jgi:hypothetical protein
MAVDFSHSHHPLHQQRTNFFQETASLKALFGELPFSEVYEC